MTAPQAGERIAVGALRVAPVLHAFVRDEGLPGSGIDEAAFWSGVEAILAAFAPRNRALLARREELQGLLDAWHTAHPGPVRDQAETQRLTPQEAAVARLAAEGRTNREVATTLVLSVKTVEHHLSRVYAKLGIRSRTELVRALPEASPEP